jgi:hypothetical protein
MNAITVGEADRRHVLCANTRIRYQPVDHQLFRRFSERSRRFLRALSDSDSHEYWQDFARTIGRYRFKLMAAPLSFSDGAATVGVKTERLRSFLSQSAAIYPQLALVAREVGELLLELAACDDNPMMDWLVSMMDVEPELSTVVMLRDSSLVDKVHHELRSRHMGFEVVSIGAHRCVHEFSRLILIGPTRWFPEHLFSAPQVPTIEVISYRWNRSRWRPHLTFVSRDSALPPSGGEDAAEDGDGDVEELWPEVDWQALAQRYTSGFDEPSGHESHEPVEAQLVSLQGAHGVFLEAHASALVIDFDEDEESRVKRVEAREIEPGMCLLLRTIGGGDYVVPVADRLLGARAATLRQAQELWKQSLRNRVRDSSLLQVSVRLIELGSQRANEGNVRNWMSQRSIRPQDQRDFSAIMKLIGREHDIDSYWNMMGDIQAAHQRSGQAIRRRLLERVRATDVSALVKTGRMDFSLPEAEGGRLTAFRVEGKSPHLDLVPASRCGQQFPFGE